jgi:hypothetical protein
MERRFGGRGKRDGIKNQAEQKGIKGQAVFEFHIVRVG